MSALETAGQPQKMIGQILLEKGRISKDQLETVLKAQEKGIIKGRIGDLLVQLELLTPDDVREAWAEQIGVEFVDLEKQKIDPEAVRSIPQSLVMRYSVFPYQMNSRRIVLAMDDPSNVFALDDIRLITGKEIKPVLPKTGQVAEFLKDYDAHANHTEQSRGTGGEELEEALKMLGSDDIFEKARERFSNFRDPSPTQGEVEVEAGPRSKEDEAPIIRIVNVIVQQAVKDKASHIRVEPTRRGVRVRYQIDGVWHEVMFVPKYVHAPLISRFKIMADCNIAERRIPQEGHMQFRLEGEEYHLRVFFNPTSFGEDIEVAILPVDLRIASFKRLGMAEDVECDLKEALGNRGVCIFTAGEEELLDRMLIAATKDQNTNSQSVASIEDQMLVVLPGVAQSRVNRKAGLTFANYLRTARLKSYDCIMVGRVRELETAETLFMMPDKKLYAGMTLPNVAETIRTLIYGYGMSPYLVLTQVRAIVSAKRVRVPCPNCSKEETISRDALAELGYPVEGLSTDSFTVKVASGCKECSKIGYKGTTTIFEVLLPDPSMAMEALGLSGKSDYSDLMANARMTFKRDALAKLLAGKTTLEELARALR